MLNRRAVFAALAFAMTAMFTLASHAADKQRYTQEALQSALKAGRPVLVEVTAPWCPVCTKQKPILAQLTGDQKFKDLAVFEVDFDSQKDVLRALNVQMQSTLIVYKGGKEAGRSTGDTNQGSIAALLNKSI